MQPNLTAALAAAHDEDLARAAQRRRGLGRRRPPRRGASDVSRLWQALTVRLATAADGPAIARLAELDEAAAPAGPLLLGIAMQRPIAALSLNDGRVIADPFTPSCDVVELMRLRARQLREA